MICIVNGLTFTDKGPEEEEDNKLICMINVFTCLISRYDSESLNALHVKKLNQRTVGLWRYSEYSLVSIDLNSQQCLVFKMYLLSEMYLKGI